MSTQSRAGFHTATPHHDKKYTASGVASLRTADESSVQ